MSCQIHWTGNQFISKIQSNRLNRILMSNVTLFPLLTHQIVFHLFKNQGCNSVWLNRRETIRNYLKSATEILNPKTLNNCFIWSDKCNWQMMNTIIWKSFTNNHLLIMIITIIFSVDSIETVVEWLKLLHLEWCKTIFGIRITCLS